MRKPLTFGARTAWYLGVLILLSCSKQNYSIQMFTFPAGTAAHGSGWTHRGELQVFTSKGGSPFELGQKKVRLKIVDKDMKVFFDDEWEYSSAEITGKFSWNDFAVVSITLMEQGSSLVQDDYNKALMKSGPKVLDSFELRLKPDGSKFEVVSKQREGE